MDEQSRKKVIKAGFSIIRKADEPSIRIKIRDGKSPYWRTQDTFKTKAERDRWFNEMLNLSNVIQD
jgi:hypothetical protein